jgi:hypothetical protein
MKKQFVTYAIALKLKKLRFNEKCLGGYNGQTLVHEIYFSCKNSDEWYKANYMATAPLWQQVFDWLREKHNIVITPDVSVLTKNAYFHIQTDNGLGFWSNDQSHPLNYYAARALAVTNALKLIKNDK